MDAGKSREIRPRRKRRTRGREDEVRGMPFEAVLLAENYHRTANDLAVAVASLDIAARSAPAADAAVIAQSRERIAGVARLQRLLIPPLEEGTADAADAVAEVCGLLARTHLMSACDTLTLRTMPAVVDAKACWLIVLAMSELVANCGKHAFGTGRGNVTVTLSDGHAGLLLRVSDDGCGSATEGTATQRLLGAGRGTAIVDAIAKRLGGAVVRRSSTAGTIVDLSVPPEALGRTYAQMKRCGGAAAGTA